MAGLGAAAELLANRVYICSRYSVRQTDKHSAGPREPWVRAGRCVNHRYCAKQLPCRLAPLSFRALRGCLEQLPTSVRRRT